jgi:D-alanine transaminase
MSNIVYLNKEYLPLKEAKISVMDRGFLFSDGVYEVVPIYGSLPFLPKEHYARMEKSLESVKIAPPISYEDFLAIIDTLLKRNESQLMQAVYIQITRGVSWDRQAFVQGLTPTVFARLETVMHPVNQSHMLKAVTAEDLRWGHCDIKGINRLANVLMVQTAFFAGMDEAIIIKDDEIVEGCSSNVFMVEKDIIYTPPLSNRLLNGVTRKMVMDLAKMNYKVEEKNITRQQLLSADEVWLTSSTREIAAVSEIDGQLIGSGVMGPVIKDIQKKYRQHIDELVKKSLNRKNKA